jgi:hypothetical protein
LVVKLDGVVEVLHRGTDAWVALAVGDAVQVGDQVRTPPEGSLELSFDVTEIKVHEESVVEISLLEPKEVRVKVNGSTEAHASGGQVSLEAGGAAIHSKGGRVSLAFDGATATASALEGRATVSVGGNSVELTGGEFATARGAALSRAAKIPSAVSLEVNWPPEVETNRPTLTVKGRVSPSAKLTVDGRKVVPAPDGTFETHIALKRGRQTIIVVAVDAFGRRAVRARQITLDPEAPRIRGAVEYQ